MLAGVMRLRDDVRPGEMGLAVCETATAVVDSSDPDSVLDGKGIPVPPPSPLLPLRSEDGARLAAAARPMISPPSDSPLARRPFGPAFVAVIRKVFFAFAHRFCLLACFASVSFCRSSLRSRRFLSY